MPESRAPGYIDRGVGPRRRRRAIRVRRRSGGRMRSRVPVRPARAERPAGGPNRRC